MKSRNRHYKRRKTEGPSKWAQFIDLQTLPSPCIELAGLPNTGKNIVGRALANRFGGTFLSFPNFSLDTVTGPLLLKLYSTKESDYINPVVWQLLFAANINESRETLLNHKGPIFCANYLTSFRKFSIGIMEYNRAKLFPDLPEPKICLLFRGGQIETSTQVPTPVPVKNSISYEFNLNSMKGLSIRHLEITSSHSNTKKAKDLLDQSTIMLEAAWNIKANKKFTIMPID
jgi:hypothetical protein